MTGAKLLVQALEHEGVEVIFGYPGGAVLPIYDELYHSRIRHILVRHEQGAVHAADAYARVSGKPGVCMATSGPGATNLVTGIANAYMDSIPVIAITGQVAVNYIGKDSFQEADITGITLPITKHSYLVKDVRDLATVIREAFYIATTGRPGPVVIDLPRDVSAQRVKYNYPPELKLAGYRVKTKGNAMQIAQATRVLLEAQRPVICAGGGTIISEAHEELLQLAEKLGAPVTTTLMGKGAFPETHPLSLGMLGMHGTRYANYAVINCDLLLALGMRFDDRVTGKIDAFARHAKIIHVDIDAAEIGKNVRVNVPIVGDVKHVLLDLLKNLEDKEFDFSAWREQIDQWKREYPLKYERGGKLKPQYIIQKIYEVTKGDAIICTEVGQNQMWAAQYYPCSRPRTFISSGGLGTMGFGLPAAIGAQVARPDAIVIDIAGDGSVQMTSQELATAVQYGLPINIAILNNGYLGMVRQWQELFYGRRYSQSRITGPDFVRLAEAYGAKGIRVVREEEVVPALEEAINSRDPYVIDFHIDPEENVYPMVPAGESLEKMLGGGSS